MSIYKQLIDEVQKGKRFSINLKDKRLKIDGKEIELEGNLIEEHDCDNVIFHKEKAWSDLKILYLIYRRSVPSERSKGNKPYFKPLDIEELDDNDLAFGESRDIAQAMLEGFVLLASKAGWLTWDTDNKWFWQDDTYKELVVLKDWI